MDPDARAAEYDGQYGVWLRRQGPRALDREWRLRNLLWRQRVLLRRYPVRGKRVLDFGCMDGIFALTMQALGAQAVGYDVSPAAIAQARTFRGSDTHPVFTNEPPGRGQFDLVFCNEVLEHIDDDTKFVGHLTEFLTPGGMLIGTTPVGRSFWDPDHKRLYDEARLGRALAPWGRYSVKRYYKSPLRNLLPFRQKGAAVFIFDVTPKVS
jgi:2-polyprenyl-3-methyl-5-hydroxy-6-metoxy-1,4-benzoquinol methylase